MRRGTAKVQVRDVTGFSGTHTLKRVQDPYGHKPASLPAKWPLPQANQQVSELYLILEPYRRAAESTA